VAIHIALSDTGCVCLMAAVVIVSLLVRYVRKSGD
jgi:hypothetical protein